MEITVLVIRPDGSQTLETRPTPPEFLPQE